MVADTLTTDALHALSASERGQGSETRVTRGGEAVARMWAARDRDGRTVDGKKNEEAHILFENGRLCGAAVVSGGRRVSEIIDDKQDLHVGIPL